MIGRDFLLQTDWRNERLDQLGSSDWITVFSRHQGDTEHAYIWSALAPNKDVKGVLEHFGPDIKPGTSPSSHPDSIQPLAIILIGESDENLSSSDIEILDEFRLFHNLPSNADKGFPGTSSEKDIIRVTGLIIEIQRQAIKEFLLAKAMTLVLYFSINRWTNIEVDDLTEADLHDSFQSDTVLWNLDTVEAAYLETSSQLLGKKLIR